MTDSVHVEIPHLSGHALFEGAVDWRACSAVAVESAIAGREGRVPDAGNARAIWAAMVKAGQVSKDAKGNATGAFLSNCVWALQQRGYHTLETLDYPANLDALHALIKDAALAGDPVVLLVTNGQALPDNEGGVEGHYVVSAGIDSAAGYLILNGDTRTAIAGQAKYRAWPACSQVPTNWATWSTLQAAKVGGAIRVKANPAPVSADPIPTPAAPAAPVAASAAQQVAAAVEQVSVAVAALQAAVKAL